MTAESARVLVRFKAEDRESYWHSADPAHGDMPHGSRPVWVFCPDVGNEDDGYGYVMVGRYSVSIFGSGVWLDDRGKGLHGVERVTLWACMQRPEPPFLREAQ